MVVESGRGGNGSGEVVGQRESRSQTALEKKTHLVNNTRQNTD